MSNKKNITEQQCVELFAELCRIVEADHQLWVPSGVPYLPCVQSYCRFIDQVTRSNMYDVLLTCSDYFAETIRGYMKTYNSFYSEYEKNIYAINYFGNYNYFIDQKTKDGLDAACREIHSYDGKLRELKNELELVNRKFPLFNKRERAEIKAVIERYNSEIRTRQCKWSEYSDLKAHLFVEYKPFDKNYYKIIYDLFVDIEGIFRNYQDAKLSISLCESTYFDVGIAKRFYEICNGEQFENIAFSAFYNAINAPVSSSGTLLPLKKEMTRICYLVDIMSSFVFKQQDRDEWVKSMVNLLEFDLNNYSKKKNATDSADDKRSRKLKAGIDDIQKEYQKMSVPLKKQ